MSQPSFSSSLSPVHLRDVQDKVGKLQPVPTLVQRQFSLLLLMVVVVVAIIVIVVIIVIIVVVIVIDIVVIVIVGIIIIVVVIIVWLFLYATLPKQCLHFLCGARAGTHLPWRRTLVALRRPLCKIWLWCPLLNPLAC